MSEKARPHIDHSAVAESINEAVNYTMFAVFREDRTAAAPADAASTIARIEERIAGIEDLTVRGWYDISGFRADADVLLWVYAPTTEALQSAYRVVFEEAAGRLLPTWSNIGVHRAAEFNRTHVPAFLAGEEPGDYLCLYPFVRTKDWYVLPDEERARMLRQHGGAARDYGDVLGSTLASFALGDYEWLLAFESADLLRIVDLMRDLRATDARRHVLEETPFFTGPRKDAQTLLGRAFS